MIHKLHSSNPTPAKVRRGWRRLWWLPFAALALVAAHGLVLSSIWAKWALAIGAGALVLMVLAHLGVLGWLAALFHRKRRGGEASANTDDRSSE